MGVWGLHSVATRVAAAKLTCVLVSLIAAVTWDRENATVLAAVLVLVHVLLWRGVSVGLAFTTSLALLTGTVIKITYPVLDGWVQSVKEWDEELYRLAREQREFQHYKQQPGRTVEGFGPEGPFEELNDAQYQSIYLTFAMPFDQFNSTFFFSEMGDLLGVPSDTFRLANVHVKRDGTFACELRSIHPHEDAVRSVKDFVLRNTHPVIRKYHLELLDGYPFEDDDDGGGAIIDVYKKASITLNSLSPEDVCVGPDGRGKVDLLFTMHEGHPPWYITWNDGKTNYPHPSEAWKVWKSPAIYPMHPTLGNHTFRLGQIGMFGEDKRLLGDHNCAAEALGGEVIVRVHPLPTGKMTGGGNIWEGKKAKIIVAITGVPPYSFYYSVNDTHYAVKDIRPEDCTEFKKGNECIYEFETTQEGQYRLLNVTDRYCTGWPIDGVTVQVKVSPIPCSDTTLLKTESGVIQSEYACSLNCSWIIQPEPQEDYEGIELRIQQLNIGEHGQLCIFDGTSIEHRQIDCLRGDIRNNKLVLFRSSSPAMLVWFSTKDNCTHIPNGGFSASYRAFKEEENCVVLPTASIIGGKCVGDTVQISFTGTPPWQLTYLEGWERKIVPNITTPVYSFRVENKEYIFEKVTDKFCDKKVQRSRIELKPNPLPTAHISGGGSILDGQTAEIQIDLTGSPPWSFSVTDGTFEEVFREVKETPFTVNVSRDGVYRVKDLEDNNHCQGSSSGEARVIVCKVPSASIQVKGNGVICEGEEAEIQIHLSGTPPWNIEYQLPSGEIRELQDITESPVTVHANEPGVYSVTKIYGCSTSVLLQDSVTISKYLLPTGWLGGGGEICPHGDKTPLVLTLTGTPPWIITYTDGFRLYTETVESATEIGQRVFQHTILVDRGGDYQLVKIEDAKCINYNPNTTIVKVTTLPEPTATISGGHCLGDTLEVHLTGRAPWTFSYQIESSRFLGSQDEATIGYPEHETSTSTPVVVHTDQTPFLIKTNSSGKFFLLEVTDRCWGTVYGSPFVIHELPTATLSCGIAMCKSSSTQLSIQLTGTAPWTLTYTFNGTPHRIQDIQESPFSLVVHEKGLYQLVSVEDANCDHGIIGGDAFCHIEEHYPKAKFIHTEKDACAGSPLTVELSGTPPWTINYAVGDQLKRIEATTSPFSLPTERRKAPKPPVVYKLLEVEDESGCKEQLDDQIIVYPIPTAKLSGGGVICPGDETQITITFTGEPEWTAVYTDGKNIFVEKNIRQANWTTTKKEPGNYYLTEIWDAHCHNQYHRRPAT